MARKSAGILAFRRTQGFVEVLLAHPGGQFWSKRDLGAWSMPKGEHADDEESEAAARREFQEETGIEVTGKLIPLGTVRQHSGKLVTAFAVEADIDMTDFKSNLFAMEWPPQSGQDKLFPEVDRIEWFSLADASNKLVAGQRPLLDLLSQATASAASAERCSGQ